LLTRQAEFQLEEHALNPPFAGTLKSAATHTVSLRRIFFELGQLVTPLAQDDFTRWYAAIRYANWLTSGQKLRVRKEFAANSVDSRYRGLFGEEIAIGLMTVTLMDKFKAFPINNTAEVLPKPWPEGPIADFVAQIVDPLSGAKTCVIAECKGSLGRQVSAERLKHAKTQVEDTKVNIAGATSYLRLTFASSIMFENSKKQSRCRVADPASDDESPTADIEPATMWNTAYAKALRFAGLDSAFAQVRDGRPAYSLVAATTVSDHRDTADRRAYQRAAMRERFGVDVIMDTPNAAVVLDRDVVAALSEGINPNTVRRLEAILSKRNASPGRQPETGDEDSFINPLGIGMISYEDNDPRNP
jgi:hypothetical protein